MFETAGAPTIVEPARSIVWLVLLPLLSAIAAGVLSLGRRPRDRLAAGVSIAATGGWLALAIFVAWRLFVLPHGRVLAQHVAQLARLGQLDVALDLAVDPGGAALSAVVAFVGFASVLHAAWTAEEGLASRVGFTSLLGAAATLVVTTDAWPFVVVGLELALLASWGLSRGGSRRRVGVALAGDASIAIGTVLLFWSLGGSFTPFGFSPDAQPRYALVAATNREAPEGRATLTLTSHAGALVVADDGPPLPGEPLRAPFTATLEPGSYSFRIQAGVASADSVVSHVSLAPSRAYVLVPYGPTASLRALADELEIPRPLALGQGTARALLATRTIFYVRVGTIVTWLVFLGALLRLALLARSGPARFGVALEVVPILVVALRVAPIVEASWPSIAALGIVVAAAAVVFAGDAAAASDPQHAVRGALAALVAVALSAILAGDASSAVVVAIAAVLGASAAACGATGDGDVRWLGVACAAMTGLLPGAGVSTGVTAALAAEVASGRGSLAAALSVVAMILVAAALFRMYGARIGVAAGAGGLVPRVVVAALAIASLAGGAALGVATTPFGGRTAPLARGLVAATSSAIDGAPRLFAVAAAASVVAAGLGLLLARRASEGAAPRWLEVLGLPARVAARAASAVGAVARRGEGAVASMDDDVLDDVFGVVASAAVRVGAFLRRGDSLAARVTDAGIERAGVAVMARLRLDDPRARDLARTGLVLAMVVLLGVIVLSSVLLG